MSDRMVSAVLSYAIIAVMLAYGVFELVHGEYGGALFTAVCAACVLASHKHYLRALGNG